MDAVSSRDCIVRPPEISHSGKLDSIFQGFRKRVGYVDSYWRAGSQRWGYVGGVPGLREGAELKPEVDSVFSFTETNRMTSPCSCAIDEYFKIRPDISSVNVSLVELRKSSKKVYGTSIDSEDFEKYCVETKNTTNVGQFLEHCVRNRRRKTRDCVSFGDLVISWKLVSDGDPKFYDFYITRKET